MSERNVGPSLLGMELEVEVWLASQEVRLGQLLDLKVGDVLPLAGNPEERVDLVANGVTLASGELVVLDGKFGLRVTSTASQKLAELDQRALASPGRPKE
jgi:flagellar motor switch protein FliN/FliY